MFWKRLTKTLFKFLKGKTCRVVWGPLRGLYFEMSDACGLAALFSRGSSSESNTQKELVRRCRVGGLAVDCGANWGLHTLLLSRLVGPNGRVLAVEANPENQRLIMRNLSVNGIQNVKVIKKALGKKVGVVRFNIGAGSTTGRIAKNDETFKVIKVKSTTLDELVKKETKPVSLVKMDIEGAESLALEGAIKTLSVYRPAFVIELHTPENDLAVARMMVQNEYGLFRLDGSKIAKPDCSWPDPEGVFGTIVCIPQEKKSASCP